MELSGVGLGGGGEGRVNSLSCFRLAASWNSTEPLNTLGYTLRVVPYFPQPIVANAREKRYR